MTAAQSSQQMWLVRRQDLRILRPMPQAELIQRIGAGEIAANDELCPANGYWFMLSEVAEVRRYLGDVNLACLHTKDGEDGEEDTRPLQKTSLIPPKVVLENGPQAAAPVAAPKPKKRARAPVAETITAPQINPDVPEVHVDSELTARRMKNAMGVAVVFVAFIAILALFWLGSY